MMRALTLWQPWASAIFAAEDPKDIENRSRLLPPKELLTRSLVNGVLGARPFFAIHAGLNYDHGPARLAKLRAQNPDFGVVLAPGNGYQPEPIQARESVWGFPRGARIPAKEECPFGAVIGVARIRYGFDARTQKSFGVDNLPRGLMEADALPRARWWLGPIGVRLEDMVALTEPVPCKGALGYWTLPEDVEALVRKRIPVY